jgi:hypothetical protein
MAEVASTGSDPACLWCGKAFRPRGAVAKRFCSDRCRAAFHRGCRLWAMQAVAEGRLSMEAVRNAPRSPYTDAGSTISGSGAAEIPPRLTSPPGGAASKSLGLRLKDLRRGTDAG